MLGSRDFGVFSTPLAASYKGSGSGIPRGQKRHNERRRGTITSSTRRTDNITKRSIIARFVESAFGRKEEREAF